MIAKDLDSLELQVMLVILPGGCSLMAHSVREEEGGQTLRKPGSRAQFSEVWKAMHEAFTLSWLSLVLILQFSGASYQHFNKPGDLSLEIFPYSHFLQHGGEESRFIGSACLSFHTVWDNRPHLYSCALPSL